MTPWWARSFWVATVVTAGTGLAYLWMKYLLVAEDPFSVINHPWQPLMLKIHIVVSPFVVFGLGLLAGVHGRPPIPAGHGPRGGRSGVVNVIAAVLMVSSGYLIQTITHEAARLGMSILHISTGALFVVLLLVHRIRVRDRGEKSEAGTQC